ncbi:MAG: transglutaminase family protein [Chloroflexota bacterium]
MFYAIHHVSRFHYSAAIRESMMEVRMQPRSEGRQRCLTFQLATVPRATITAYVDHAGNRVHHFDVPDRHSELAVTARALVEVDPPPALPAALPPDAWDTVAAMTRTDEYWDWLEPSRFARDSDLLHALRAELGLERGRDPLTTLRSLTSALHATFRYMPQSTRADSPIDDALRARQGVCQDFAHIMIALVRQMGLPCRYVSGYLFHARGGHERSSPGATHAWVEALLPEVGWRGFDPTNDLVVADRHVRVAIGRDYDDVPPTHGVFKGHATSELSVAVHVNASQAPPPGEDDLRGTAWSPAPYPGDQQ